MRETKCQYLEEREPNTGRQEPIMPEDGMTEGNKNKYFGSKLTQRFKKKLK